MHNVISSSICIYKTNGGIHGGMVKTKWKVNGSRGFNTKWEVENKIGSIYGNMETELLR